MGQWQDALGRWPQHVTHTASHPGCVPASPHLLALRTPRRRQDQFWPVDIYMQQKNSEHRDTVYSPEKNSSPQDSKAHCWRVFILTEQHSCGAATDARVGCGEEGLPVDAVALFIKFANQTGSRKSPVLYLGF